MDVKPKELFLGAVVAITLGTFALSFGSNADAPTGARVHNRWECASSFLSVAG